VENENNNQTISQSKDSQNLVLPKRAVMRWILAILLLIVSAGFLVFKSNVEKKQATTEAEPTGILEISPEPTITLTPTVFLSPTVTKTPSVTPTSTIQPTPTLTPTPTSIPKADLYISEYSYDHPPTKDEAFTVRIAIYNQGDITSGGFWWEWWPTAYNYACRERIDSLSASGGRIVNCTYTYGGWSNYAVKAVADADNEVDESNETNNIHSESLIPIH
jgi:hypothetical protein